jgi:ribonuclease HII
MEKVKKERKDKSFAENLKIEQDLWNDGYELIAGVDDVGRGCFAGPVVCAAAIMPKGLRIHRLTDSKLISKDEYEYFAEQVKSQALAYGVGVVDVETVDKINIKNAAQLAMKIAVENMSLTPDYLLIDGNEKIALDIPQVSVIKGDFKSHSISAASIIAKVYRDNLMEELDKEFGSVYGWAKNAGYQTKSHIEACKTHGITKYHRKTWATMNQLTES